MNSGTLKMLDMDIEGVKDKEPSIGANDPLAMEPYA